MNKKFNLKGYHQGDTEFDKWFETTEPQWAAEIRQQEQEFSELATLRADNAELLEALREIVSQIGQGGANGKVFARDNCITNARALIAKHEAK